MPFHERQAFSDQQVETLKRYYDNGMNSQSLVNREKMLACAMETGLEFDTVRNWVGNYRRKLRLDAERKEQQEFYRQHGIPDSNSSNFSNFTLSPQQLLANVAVETMKNIDPSIGSSTSLQAGPFSSHGNQTAARFPLPPVSSLTSVCPGSQPAVTVLANPSGEMSPRHSSANCQEDQGLKIDSVFSMKDDLMSQASSATSSLLTDEMRTVLYSSPVNSLLPKRRESSLSDRDGTADASSGKEVPPVVTVDAAVTATNQQEAPQDNAARKSFSSATDLLNEYEADNEQARNPPREQDRMSSSLVGMTTGLPTKPSFQVPTATSSSPDVGTARKRKLSTDENTFDRTVRMGEIFQGPFERTVFTDEQVRVLTEHYEKGMNNQAKCCLDEMMTVAKELNLEFDVVRNWVGNQRRKRRMVANRDNANLVSTQASGNNGVPYPAQNGGSLSNCDDHSWPSLSREGSPELSIAQHTSRDRRTYRHHYNDQPSSGYDLYMREFLEAQGLCREDLSMSLLKEIDEGWQTLDDQQRQEYHKNALEIPPAPQDRDVPRTLQDIQQTLDELKQDGCQYLLVTHREGVCKVTGTLAPMEYWNKVQHVESFKEFLDRHGSQGNQSSCSSSDHASSHPTERRNDTEAPKERRPHTQSEEQRHDDVTERSQNGVESVLRKHGTTREFTSLLKSDEEVYIVDKNHHIIGTGKLLPAPHKKIELSTSDHKGAR